MLSSKDTTLTPGKTNSLGPLLTIFVELRMAVKANLALANYPDVNLLLTMFRDCQFKFLAS